MVKNPFAPPKMADKPSIKTKTGVKAGAIIPPDYIWPEMVIVEVAPEIIRNDYQ